MVTNSYLCSTIISKNNGCVPLIQLKHGGNPEAHLLEERSKPAPDLLGWDIPGPLAELPPPGWGDDERTSPGI